MTSPSTTAFTAYVGIDWADRKHDFCLQAAGASTSESGILAHTPEAIAKWASSLHERFGGPIAVCLEIAKGPLVYALQRHDFLVIFPVHPATLAGYRKAFVPSGAKDDPSDAQTALDRYERKGHLVLAGRVRARSAELVTPAADDEP